MRQQFICHLKSEGKEPTTYDHFESCGHYEKDLQSVLIFQLLMACIGGLAFWGVQLRKQNTMTQFEHRRQR